MMDLDRYLAQVEKPARYIGGEWNVCRKQVSTGRTRVAFCFPDTYEVGMSHLGLRILYDVLNRREDVCCERAFAPWVDMERLMREDGVPLFSLETRTPVGKFDVVAFTLQYEMSFTNVLNMLDMSGIPLRAQDREDWEHPLVVAGGPGAANPEPLSAFVDLYLVGDGEQSIQEMVDIYRRCRAQGKSKREYLEQMAQTRGCYVPSFYDVTQDETGRITAILPNNPHAKPTVEACRIASLEEADFPTDCLVPNMGIVHDRITLEIMRGCTRGCRFCQAGYLYRPIRERSKQTLHKIAEQMVEKTGYDEISLSSLSSSDHSQIGELTGELIEAFQDKRVSVALPSLRLDNFDDEIIRAMPSVRKSGLTFAPEAGTQRLRDVINKGVTQQNLIDTVQTAFQNGWHTLKLYFMIGLPTETMQDIQGIVDLAHMVAAEYENIHGRRRGLTLTVSTSTFVPKPQTPFGWYGQEDRERIYEKQRYLKEHLKARWFRYSWHDPRLSMLEACFARGGRELGEVLQCAFENGCRFDAWADYFKFGSWMSAFERCGIDPQQQASRTYEDDEILPWEMISYGVDKAFLLKEKQLAQQGITTPDCREGCRGCGLMEVCK